MPAQLYADIFLNTALYSLLLVGYQFSSVLKQTSNFAFGALIAVAGYLFWSGSENGWGMPLSALLAFVGTVIVAAIFEQVFSLFSKRQEMKQEILLIVGIGLLGAVEAVIQIVFGASAKAITVYSNMSYGWHGIHVTSQQIILSISSLVLTLAITVWLFVSKNGLSFRAVVENQATARSIAISVDKIRTAAAFISICTAVAAGMFVAAERSFSPHIGTSLVITAFVLATLVGKNARLWLPACFTFSGFEVLSSWVFGSTLAAAILYGLVFLYLTRDSLKVGSAMRILGRYYA